MHVSVLSKMLSISRDIWWYTTNKTQLCQYTYDSLLCVIRKRIQELCALHMIAFSIVLTTCFLIPDSYPNYKQITPEDENKYL